MLQQWKAELNEAKSSLRDVIAKLAECDSSVVEPPFNLMLAGTKIGYVPPWRGMKILGSMISGDGKSKVDIEYRIGKAWKAFWLQKGKCCNQLVDPAVRIRALEVFIKPVLMYASGSWTPTADDLQSLLSCHLQMCRIILGSKPRPGELYHEAA